MSYLLEALGRGLLADLRSAFENQLPRVEDDELERLRERAANSPKSADLWLRLGSMCLRTGRLREAREAFTRAQQLAPAASVPLLGLACVEDELSRLPEALALLEAAGRLDPGDPATAFGAAFCHERRGRLELARAGYAKARDLCPQLRNAYERLAALALRAHDWADAAAQYERLAEMEPGDLDVLLTLGNLYLLGGRPELALEQFQQALLIEPDGNDGTLAAAERLAGAGQLNEAIQTLEKLVQKYPGMAPFHVRLGDLYVKVGDDDRATREYRTALATQPGFLEATVKLGTQHLRQGRYVDAAVTFNRAVELNDRLMTAFVGLGVAQYDLGRTHEALATFDLAASLEPSSTLLFSETARLHLKSEQHGTEADAEQPYHNADEAADVPGGDDLLAESLRRHQQALLQAPNQADLQYRYGLLLRQVGRYDEAIESFRRAVAILPSYTKALIKLAISLKECGRVDEAVSTFQQALRLEPRQIEQHYELGLLFAQRSQFDLATEEFEQVQLGQQPGSAFRANLALVLQNIGMVDRAAATWRSICDLGPPDALLEQREHVLRHLNRK